MIVQSSLALVFQTHNKAQILLGVLSRVAAVVLDSRHLLRENGGALLSGMPPHSKSQSVVNMMHTVSALSAKAVR